MDRNRRDSLQLIRIQDDVLQLGLALRNMERSSEAGSLTAYREQLDGLKKDLQEALAKCADGDEVFICGGGEIYREAMLLASRIYLTVVHLEVDGDTLFPMIPEDFLLIRREEIKGAVSCTYLLYERV